MERTNMLDLTGAKLSIKDHIKDSDNVEETFIWFEGWICGYTDRDHKYNTEENNKVHDELFDYLSKLKEEMLIESI